MHKGIWIALAVATGAVGVAIAASPQDAPQASQDAAWYNKQMLAITGLKAEDGWKPLPGNLRWRRVKGDGTGRHPTPQDTVTIHYAGTLVDGTEFDSSWARNEPATFPLGMLIEGWQIAVPMAGVGDTIEIAIPSDKAYGPVGKGDIPGGATLFFKIELLGIE